MRKEQTMDEQKQIEEMAQDIWDSLPDYEHNFRDCRDAAQTLLFKGYRKQSEGEWIDRYNGKYANSLYVCSFCDERAPLYIKADELGNEQIIQMLSQFCPNCGSHMKGV